MLAPHIMTRQRKQASKQASKQACMQRTRTSKHSGSHHTPRKVGRQFQTQKRPEMEETGPTNNETRPTILGNRPPPRALALASRHSNRNRNPNNRPVSVHHRPSMARKRRCALDPPRADECTGAGGLRWLGKSTLSPTPPCVFACAFLPCQIPAMEARQCQVAVTSNSQRRAASTHRFAALPVTYMPAQARGLRGGRRCRGGKPAVGRSNGAHVRGRRACVRAVGRGPTVSGHVRSIVFPGDVH